MHLFAIFVIYMYIQCSINDIHLCVTFILSMRAVVVAIVW